ncbi:uncharacterized protein LOC123564255 [Mercenaria mercenaria]|uniref:uncharacterized protein LOC123564255 n=1 Tax=Mercenaria mercenaria TaxID=6596 RepID=UPI00234F7695|nr:uncharacterized protein LOC123564255 [Mercenaria mercenaria]
MNKISKAESQQRQRPIQNFPDYLKYVAKKSKAGFDKVHEELYRIYSESFNTADKSVPQPYNQHVTITTNHGTLKSKIGLRQRWSRRSGLFWSSTGQEIPTGHSFTSYIPEEKEDLGSSTSSKSEFDILSDELDTIKHENHAFHNNGICTAAVYNKDKNIFDFDNIRTSMPHSELTDEVIYTNDRVLRVEKMISLSKEEEEEEDPSAIYSVPKLKYDCYEIDDYVNLRAPCQLFEDISDAEKTEEVEPVKKMKTSGSRKSFKNNTMNVSSQYESKKAKRQALAKTPFETEGDHNDDDDYLPPSQWTQSCYTPAHGECISDLYAKISKKHMSPNEKPNTTVTNNGVENSNTQVRTELQEQNGTEADDSYYVPPSKWAECDYETIPSTNETMHLYENIENRTSVFFSKEQDSGMQSDKSKDIGGDKADYDRPFEWLQFRGQRTDIDITNNSDTESKDKQVTFGYFHRNVCSGNMKVESTAEDLYTKVVKDKAGDSSEPLYSVPTCNKLVTTEIINSNENSSEGNYSVPRWRTPKKVKSFSVPDIKQHLYSVPTPPSRELSVPNHLQTEHIYENVQSSDENGTITFYNYTVDEIVECLNNCALSKLAEICEQNQLDGEYFRSLTTDDLKKEPFLMNWFYISKLFKVINGWRPKGSFRK